VVLPLNQNVREQALQESAEEPADVDESSAPASAVTDTRGLILLAEDNRINAAMVSEYLESQEYNVITAENGEQVLEIAAHSAPDLILMDIQMPKMDGLEATRQLRADSRFTATPIIALTALVMPGDKERCLEAGANQYLSKPVSLKLLLATIEKLMKRKA
jgi:CheY-like chemotaxis protein